jgi:hypothetical protein
LYKPEYRNFLTYPSSGAQELEEALAVENCGGVVAAVNILLFVSYLLMSIQAS